MLDTKNFVDYLKYQKHYYNKDKKLQHPGGQVHVLAKCCDKDGLCFGDGTDDWCCEEKFYCSTNSEEYASKQGGIVCPQSVRRETAKYSNIAGIAIMVFLMVLMLCWHYDH